MSSLKKVIIVILAVIVCSTMFMFASKFQNMYAQKDINNSNIEENISKNSYKDKNKEINELECTPQGDTNDEYNNKEDYEQSIEDVQDAKTNSNSASSKNDKDNMNTEISSVKDDSSQKKVKDNSSNKNEIKNITKVPDKPKQNTEKTPTETLQPEETAETKKDDTPVEEYNFEIKDEVHNKIIIQKYVELEGKSVGEITCKVLDEAKISYKATGSSSNLYFASIDGISHMEAGPLSGWVYYIKKKDKDEYFKPSVGSSQYVCEKGDKVIWKYVEDGVSD